ncbi:MAG: flagellar biosynthetic protein FliO [Alphaproteobacteria bacterium]|nr:flagellar biosynthetic protein FliO [Alphaproteobacteria bacterium]
MDYTDYLKFFAALILVLGLMGGLAFILKRLGYAQTGLNMGKNKRLKLIEVLPLDARRKAVIIECDEKQHLILLGPNGELVVDNNLKQQSSNKANNDSKK